MDSSIGLNESVEETEYSTDAYTDDDFTNDCSIDNASRTGMSEKGQRSIIQSTPTLNRSPASSGKTFIAEPKVRPTAAPGEKRVFDGEHETKEVVESPAHTGPTPGEKTRPRSFNEKSDMKEPKYLWAEAKLDPSPQRDECELKTPVRIERSGGPISTDAYISVKDINMTEAEAKYLYGIEKTHEEPLKIVIIHDSNERPKKKAVTTFSVARIEELSKPRDMTAVLDKHKKQAEKERSRCRLRSSRAGREQLGNFLDRMVAGEKQRQKNIERRMMEAEYEAKVDKKICFNCGGTQSFDEMLEGRIMCPNDECGDRFQYKNPTQFVLRRFEQRMERSNQRRCDTMEKIQVDQYRTREQRRGKKSRKQKELMDKVEKSGKKFLDRMADDVVKRKNKINRLGEELQHQVEKSCSFKPQLNISEQHLRNRISPKHYLSEPKHRKANEISRTNDRPKTTKRQRPKKSKSLTRPSVTHAPKSAKRRVSVQKKSVSNRKEVARKFEGLLL